MNLEVQYCKCVVPPMDISSVSSASTMNSVRLAEAYRGLAKGWKRDRPSSQTVELVCDGQERIMRVPLPHTTVHPVNMAEREGITELQQQYFDDGGLDLSQEGPPESMDGDSALERSQYLSGMEMRDEGEPNFGPSI